MVMSICHLSNNVEQLFTAGCDGKIRVWDTSLDDLDQAKTTMVFNTGSNAVYCIGVRDSHKQLVSGTYDGKLQLFDLQKNKKTFESGVHSNIINCLWASDELAFTGSKDTNIMMHDFRQPQPV